MREFTVKNSTFSKMELVLKPADQTRGQFFVSQIDRCVEALQDATKNASKGKDGKPIFYTTLKRKTLSGHTQAFSVHYFNDTMREMQNLNYVTSILLNLRIDKEELFVITKSKDHQDGQALIRALSLWVNFRWKRTDYLWHEVL